VRNNSGLWIPASAGTRFIPAKAGAGMTVCYSFVIPAQAGIQGKIVDSCFRRNKLYPCEGWDRNRIYFG